MPNNPLVLYLYMLSVKFCGAVWVRNLVFDIEGGT
jgi:hypothetical protein